VSERWLRVVNPQLRVKNRSYTYSTYVQLLSR
jgi:hypothetical protein